jgi:ATP adenylyltransferase/5',5'''-P-1,P-4-tetraphosphate phosphorylase II
LEAWGLPHPFVAGKQNFAILATLRFWYGFNSQVFQRAVNAIQLSKEKVSFSDAVKSLQQEIVNLADYGQRTIKLLLLQLLLFYTSETCRL